MPSARFASWTSTGSWLTARATCSGATPEVVGGSQVEFVPKIHRLLQDGTFLMFLKYLESQYPEKQRCQYLSPWTDLHLFHNGLHDESSFEVSWCLEGVRLHVGSRRNIRRMVAIPLIYNKYTITQSLLISRPFLLRIHLMQPAGWQSITFASKMLASRCSQEDS